MSVTAILLVLMRKRKDETHIVVLNEDVLGFVQSEKKLQNVPAEQKAASVKELVQNCENLGYHMSDTTDSKYRWDAEMEKMYVPMDFIKNGDFVLIVTEAVTRSDGEVIQKGKVRKYRGN